MSFSILQLFIIVYFLIFFHFLSNLRAWDLFSFSKKSDGEGKHILLPWSCEMEGNHFLALARSDRADGLARALLRLETVPTKYEYSSQHESVQKCAANISKYPFCSNTTTIPILRFPTRIFVLHLLSWKSWYGMQVNEEFKASRKRKSGNEDFRNVSSTTSLIFVLWYFPEFFGVWFWPSDPDPFFMIFEQFLRTEARERSKKEKKKEKK